MKNGFWVLVAVFNVFQGWFRMFITSGASLRDLKRIPILFRWDFTGTDSIRVGFGQK